VNLLHLIWMIPVGAAVYGSVGGAVTHLTYNNRHFDYYSDGAQAAGIVWPLWVLFCLPAGLTHALLNRPKRPELPEAKVVER
jgi:hypothetical protein